MAVASSGRASLSSPSPPRLSLRPGAERMFLTRGEIDEEGEAAAVQEPEEDDGDGGKLYVAVGKDLKGGRSNLLWAARNLLAAGDLKLVLLHVHQPAERIMTGLCKVSASQLEEKELKAYREIEKEEMNTLLNQYLHFRKKQILQVQAETLVIEKNNAANGIVELIDQNHIENLAMGASSVSMEATQLSAKGESSQSCYTSSVSDQPEFLQRSLSLPPGHPGFLGSTDQQALQRHSNSDTYPLFKLIADNVENMSATRSESIDMTTTGFSPDSSQQSTGVSSWALKDLDSMDGSPAPVSTAIPCFEASKLQTPTRQLSN